MRLRKSGLVPALFISLLPLAASAQDMKPNKDPVPSPSDMRALRGEDRPQGQAPEDRTPSPSDLAIERPRSDGDRSTDDLPASAAAGGTQPIPENNRGEPIPSPGR